jgi:hypothetical protein
MKFANAAALLLLLTTPALADATKTTGGVSVECTVTGSSKDGFDVTADNKKGSADRDCSATCKLTKKDGSTIEKSYSKKAGKNLKVWMGGEGSVSGAPLSNPNLTSASCS